MSGSELEVDLKAHLNNDLILRWVTDLIIIRNLSCAVQVSLLPKFRRCLTTDYVDKACEAAPAGAYPTNWFVWKSTNTSSLRSILPACTPIWGLSNGKHIV